MTTQTAAPSSTPQKESTAPPSTVDQVARRVRTMIQSEVDNQDLPGAIALVSIGDSERVVVAGLANTRTRKPMSRNDRFPIASVTKPMVATAVMRLVAGGKLSLDDSVEDWLPGLVEGGDRITVEHLLSQQSGLYEYNELRQPPKTCEEGVRAAAKQYRAFEPGQNSYYSNTNYLALGLILEKVTAEPLAKVLDEQVFTPARMGDTTLDSPSQTRTGIVRAYDDGKDVTPVGGNGCGDGGAISTVRDVSRFFHALLAGDLVPPDLVSEMVKPRGGLLNNPGQYGLGIWQWEVPCGPGIGHSGRAPGIAIEAYARDADLQDAGARFAVVMVNRDDPLGQLIRPLVEAALCD